MTMSPLVLALAGVLIASGTRLESDGNILFEAGARVTFGATYSDRAVKATVCSQQATDVAIRSEREPKAVFVNGELLVSKAWAYDRSSRCLKLRLEEGTTEIQLRFDDVRSLAPFTEKVPVVQCTADWRPLNQISAVTVECASEAIRGSAVWEGMGGIYRIRPFLKETAGDSEVAIKVVGGASIGNDEAASPPRFYVPTGARIAVSGSAPGFEVPLVRLEVHLESLITPTVRLSKKELQWDKSVVVEGEDFVSEGGGSVKKSTEHKNTHEDGCIFTWAVPGHWIAWTLPVQSSGRYMLTIVGASAEDTVLRALELDGRPLPGAALISIEGTGGWGRSNPDEWQPFSPVGPDGAHLVFDLSSGEHELKITNLVGHHFNVDCILLTPRE